jgi:eukaryotic-like serine/threonine-protein kinase
MRETLVEGPDPLLGAKIAGRYTVMRKIARGGMGVVYLAVQEGLGRAVALKIIRREVAADPLMQKRFEREAKAVSSLSHPSIVTIHDFGRTEDGGLYLAMEFVDGDVLRDVLKRKRRLAFMETLPIVESIAAALARAHGAGVVHRDLKPENVILPRQSASATGIVAAKVLDFGLAKPHDPDMVEEHLTRDGGFVGTPGYAAPEQAEGQPEHPRQDLYALGVLWFELLMGGHPFAAPTPMKIVVRQLHEEPPTLPTGAGEGQLHDVPEAAALLIRALMARRPDDRPESAQAVLDALQGLKGLAPAPSGPPMLTPDERRPVESLLSALPEAPTVASAPRALEPTAAPAPLPSNPTPEIPAIVAGAAESPALANAGAGRGVAWLVAGALAAMVAGAAIVVVATGDLPSLLAFFEPEQGDDGVVPVDGAGAVPSPPKEPPAGVEIVLEGLPTFTALQAVRESLPMASLEKYARERSVLRAIGEDPARAAAVAEKLQGLALPGEPPLVLEVKELAAGHVLVQAVPPEDVGLEDGLLVDAGAASDSLSGDAGVVDELLAPGGLAP